MHLLQSLISKGPREQNVSLHFLQAFVDLIDGIGSKICLQECTRPSSCTYKYAQSNWWLKT